MDNDKIIAAIIGLTIGAIFCVFFWAMLEDMKLEMETNYRMPNGVVCKSSTITGGGFGGATHEFYRCSDSKRYVNPETYQKIKSKDKVTLIDVLSGGR